MGKSPLKMLTITHFLLAVKVSVTQRDQVPRRFKRGEN